MSLSDAAKRLELSARFLSMVGDGTNPYRMDRDTIVSWYDQFLKDVEETKEEVEKWMQHNVKG